MNTLRIAAIMGFLAVLLGAFGAHGLKEVLERHGSFDTWHTAVLYHLAHSVVLLVLAMHSERRFTGAFWFFTVGIALFSGSLYTLSLTGIKWMGAITPLGGVCFLTGWLLLIVRAGQKEK